MSEKSYIPGELYKINPSLLALNCDEAGIDQAHVRKVMDAIQAQGLAQPLRFAHQDGRLVVLSSPVQFLAVGQLGLDAVPAIFEDESRLSPPDQDALKNIQHNIGVHGSQEEWVDQWTYGYDWKAEGGVDFTSCGTLLDEEIRPFLPKEKNDILEIAPGAGRLTHELIRVAKSVTLVDLNAVCIDLCKERFKYFNHLKYHVNNGYSLQMIADGSMDAIISYDSFVHIDKGVVEKYVEQFQRILKPGGIVWIHHCASGKREAGDRSTMTDALMREFAEKNGLVVQAVLYSYPIKTPHPHYGDCITVMKRAEDM